MTALCPSGSSEIAGKAPADLLFSSPNGEPIRLANWRRRVWDPAAASVGLEGLTPHDLRHTAASLAISRPRRFEPSGSSGDGEDLPLTARKLRKPNTSNASKEKDS
jgi:integrase